MFLFVLSRSSIDIISVELKGLAAPAKQFSAYDWYVPLYSTLQPMYIPYPWGCIRVPFLLFTRLNLSFSSFLLNALWTEWPRKFAFGQFATREHPPPCVLLALSFIISLLVWVPPSPPLPSPPPPPLRMWVCVWAHYSPPRCQSLQSAPLW